MVDREYLYELADAVEPQLVYDIDGATWDYGEDEIYLTISIADSEQLLELTIPHKDLTMNDIEKDADIIVEAVMDSIQQSDNRYKFIKSKTVQSPDGSYSDYTMYYDTKENKYVFVYGDKDTNGPEDGYFDWEAEDRESAEEWFDNYTGFEDDESIESDDYLNDKW